MSATPPELQLIFILSPERSGSTLLQMMLESHTRIAGLPEPNLLPPLQYLGYYGGIQTGTVYDPVNQAQGLKEFADHLGGEETYIEACRNYAQTFYEKARSQKKEAVYFLDKTPSNVLVWPLIVKMFPKARYIVLTRHPYAIIHSYAKSFFTGDFDRMKKENTRISEHIQAVSRFLREASVKKHTVRYEDLVRSPEKEAQAILKFLDLEYEPSVVHYGSVSHVRGTMGDPLTAQKEKKPEAGYAHNWTSAFKQNASLAALSTEILSPLSEGDLETYGYPSETLLDPLHSESAGQRTVPSKSVWHYHLQRKIFFGLKGWARQGWFKKLLEKIRYYCDVLLR